MPSKDPIIVVSPFGFDMTVTYEFDPGEREIRWGDNACPGSPASVGVYEVKVGGIDIYEMLNEQQIGSIEAAILEDIEQ